jgi:hypothetical protein
MVDCATGTSAVTRFFRLFRPAMICFALLLAFRLVPACAGAFSAPTAEFDTPYQVKLSPDGETVEISGSFSWALPQNLQALLGSAPLARLVHLESPGGYVQSAMQVATIIQQRGLDTFVGRLCASACTIAFLAGRNRWLAPAARLGFHQAFAPGFPPEQANQLLQIAYQNFHVPASFIARVLQVPHTGLWYPPRAELQSVRITTGAAPAFLHDIGGTGTPRLNDIARLLPAVPDEAVVEFATTLAALLPRLQDANPEACWAFAHEGPDDPRASLPPGLQDAIAAMRARVAAMTETRRAHRPESDAGQLRKALADLFAVIRADGRIDSVMGLQIGAAHETFCPALHVLLVQALALPDSRRATTVRAVLWDD